MARKKNLATKKEYNKEDHPDDGGKLKPGPGRESFKLAQYWKSQEKAYDEASARWTKRGNTVIKRFRDERSRISEEGQRRMNLLWTNYKIMKPAVFSKCPIPIIDRKFLDKDVTGRLSSQILERSVKNQLDTNGFFESVNMAVGDKLLPGRGVVWIRYVPEIGEGISIPAQTQNGAEDPLFKIGEEFGDTDLTESSEEDDALEQKEEQVLSENTEIDYVDWRDFYVFPVKARNWKEVQAIGKKTYITKKDAIERFGKEIGEALKPDTEPQILGNSERQTYSETAIFQDANERNITIMEIWNKSDRRVYWHSGGYDYLCDVKDDPLKLTGFFPVPKPIFATMTNDTLFPVPDYLEWQDQAIQIDELTQRIAMLTKSCKVAGTYNAAVPAINRIFNESIENELIPVDQWAMFADAGGLKGAIDFIPIDQVQKCIETLQKVRQQAMIDLDQVTGLSDVLRGTTDSRETLGGLKLKNNNAGTRLSEDQEEVARFCRDIIVITAEIICKHFSDETIIQSSGILFEDALQPDTIMREWLDQNAPPEPPPQPDQGQPPQGQPQQPGGGQPQPPKALPAPMPRPGMPPQQGSPLAPMLGQLQASNVIPFNPASPLQPQQTMMPPMPPDPEVLIMQKVDKAIKLLRDDVPRGYRIDIETDSTIFGDKYQERQDATEFITALGGFFKQFETISQSAPQALPLLAKTLQWGVRKYRTGRDLESEVDNFVSKMTKMAKKMEDNPPPSAEMAKANASIEIEKTKAGIQAQNDQRDQQRMERDDQRQFQMDQAKDQREKDKMNMEMQIEREKMQMEKEKMQMDIQLAREKHRMELQKLQAGIAADQQTHMLDAHAQQQEHAMDMHGQQQELAAEREKSSMQMDNERHKADVQKQTLDNKQQANEQAHKLKMKQQASKPKPKKKAS